MKGKCHICQRYTEIEYCDFCKHYLCASCSSDYLRRGMEAVKELYKKLKRTTGGGACCGPIK